MHDAVVGEKQGTPSVGIMTTNFVGAAELMARALGAEGYAFVVIGHPISSATREALDRWARRAAFDSAKLLTGAHP